MWKLAARTLMLVAAAGVAAVVTPADPAHAQVAWTASHRNASAEGTWTSSFLYPFPLTVTGTLTVSAGSACYEARLWVSRDLAQQVYPMGRQCGVGSTPVSATADRPEPAVTSSYVYVCEVQGSTAVSCGPQTRVG